MTSRRGRRGAGGLHPDERSMGGALLIQSDYQNYYRKLSEVRRGSPAMQAVCVVPVDGDAAAHE